jgi:hypothetical protein
LSGTSPVTIASTGVIACATCNTTAAVATPPFDKSATGLSNPTADATFTYPIASTTGLTLAGTAPASVSTTPGTNATSLFNINGVAGGATTNASGTGGIGSSPSITAGAGGAASGATASTGGAGGSVNFTAGAGGAGAGTGVNANGGSVVVTPGAAGTGGSGTAGKAGVLSVAGSTAGSVFYTQGSTNTVANTNIPANSIIEQAPAAVTAYTITKPGSGGERYPPECQCVGSGAGEFLGRFGPRANPDCKDSRSYDFHIMRSYRRNRLRTSRAISNQLQLLGIWNRMFRSHSWFSRPQPDMDR